VTGHDVLVIGASAGGIEVLIELASQLPADYPGSVFVTVHIPAWYPSELPAILDRRGALRAKHPVQNEPIQYGHIYVAPPDHHLLIRPGHIQLSRGPKENRFRPAIDPMFRTAAQSYGNKVAGLILSGVLEDGAAGLWKVKKCGGVALVQHPDDAVFPQMPFSALESVEVDYMLRVSEMGARILDLARSGEPRSSLPPGAEELSPCNQDR
jgi:two-component system chemotaxis response regulator CheB